MTLDFDERGTSKGLCCAIVMSSNSGTWIVVYLPPGISYGSDRGKKSSLGADLFSIANSMRTNEDKDKVLQQQRERKKTTVMLPPGTSGTITTV